MEVKPCQDVLCMKIRKRLKTVRLANKCSQLEAAKLIGLSQSQYSKLERGTSALTVCDLVNLAKGYKIDPILFFQNETKEDV